jgi:predicted Zn-dependent protease
MVFRRGGENQRRYDGLSICWLHTTGKTRGARAAVDHYLRHQADLASAADPIGRSWAEVNAAWHAVLTGDPLLLPMADQLSKAALERLPTVPAARGTRGAVLFALGDQAEGEAMLLAASKDASNVEDKVEFSRFLARAARQQGDSALASDYELAAIALARSALAHLTIS